MTKKHALWYFICSLNFKSHNFQTESLSTRVASTYRGSTTLGFFVLQLCLTFITLWIQNPAHVKQCIEWEAKVFLYLTIQWVVRVESAQASFFPGTKKLLHSANLQATIQAAGFLQVLLKSFFKKLLLGTGLWQHDKISTTLKTPDGLNNAECKKSCWTTGRPSRTCLR